ncbi:hypothetical protein N7478_013229 [Penicillium angulare]|uniref:uncharacterized protein n=1 Tax=Penicillium angulare TaxID=116970 RepID=UPI0025425C45|nr:uncharacterized protein N7478_013229 [Penicillium angulare]KAJ5257125.1 hypothetical protein N7478_013229 [Penicillium angulare]
MTSHENYSIFRECLSSAIVARSEKPKTKRRTKVKRGGRKQSSTVVSSEVVHAERANPEELAEFIDSHKRETMPGLTSRQFIASETFTSFPEDLRILSYAGIQHDPNLSNIYIPIEKDAPLDRSVLDSICTITPVDVTETLSVYGLIPEPTDFPDFISPVLSEYVSSVTSGPPEWSATRADACEICERDWIPLSYHHLIPRGVHAKVIKKGWHDEWMLNSVAWLCRACHSFVHRMASNEELAREWFTVERIMERADVQDWAKWVSRTEPLPEVYR